MKRSDLIKKLLPGFIPLFVFIAADEIWGTKVGLIVALVIGIMELGYTFIKEKRFDKFILLDTSLLIVLGGISILLDNDIFFKIKPAIIEAIMCVILAVSAFTRIDIVGGMSQRYMKGLEMSDEVQKKFKKTLKTMFWIFTAHTLLVVYAAFFMSKEAWAFISGGLFYILFAIYFLYEFFQQKRKAKNAVVERFEDEEWLPVVDEEGKIVGKALRSACHSVRLLPSKLAVKIAVIGGSRNLTATGLLTLRKFRYPRINRMKKTASDPRKIAMPSLFFSIEFISAYSALESRARSFKGW